jgi:hypothetical protein
MCRGSSAPDVTSTDHDTDLHVEIAHFLNSLRDGEDDLWRNIFPSTGELKRFAASFKNDALISGGFRLHGASRCRNVRVMKTKMRSYGRGRWSRLGSGERTGEGAAARDDGYN